MHHVRVAQVLSQIGMSQTEHKTMSSKPLSREKCLIQLYRVPAALRRKLLPWMNRKMEDRDASDRLMAVNPGKMKVTDVQRRLMLTAHNAGVSFRALETIFHLRYQSGNAAQRCCQRAAMSAAPSNRTHNHGQKAA